MFICDECLKKHYKNMPSILKSRGPCEICHANAICSDIPSKYLQRQATLDADRFYPAKED